MIRTWKPLPEPYPAWQDVILFDGVCVLCSGWVAFVIARDRDKRFRFAAIQSAAGTALATRFGIDRDAPETNAVIVDGTAYFKSDSALQVLSRLPGWHWVRVLALCPRDLRNWAYDRVAKNRYRLFGRTATCMVPTAEVRERFVGGVGK
jgi:predicted DCC family thiol-disulfide oxidoreductase YuxK